jgi:hypothetical protein
MHQLAGSNCYERPCLQRIIPLLLSKDDESSVSDARPPFVPIASPGTPLRATDVADMFFEHLKLDAEIYDIVGIKLNFRVVLSQNHC